MLSNDTVTVSQSQIIALTGPISFMKRFALWGRGGVLDCSGVSSELCPMGQAYRTQLDIMQCKVFCDSAAVVGRYEPIGDLLRSPISLTNMTAAKRNVVRWGNTQS